MRPVLGAKPGSRSMSAAHPSRQTACSWAYSSAASALAYANMALVTGGSIVFRIVFEEPASAVPRTRNAASLSRTTFSVWPCPNPALNSAAASPPAPGSD